MDMIAIGSKIKEARERAHLTQEELAEIIDISPTHMSVIERGVKTQKLDTFVKIVKALNLSADALLLEGMDQVNDSIVAELSVRLGRLSDEDRNRILNAIRALTVSAISEDRETGPLFCILSPLSTDFPICSAYTKF